MSDLQAGKKEIYKLSAIERLQLLEAIAQSLQEELRPRKPVPAGTLTGLRGLLKTAGKSLTDAEVEEMKAESLVEKYLK